MLTSTRRSIILKFVTAKPIVRLQLLDESKTVPYGKTITLQTEIKSCFAPQLVVWSREKIKNREGERNGNREVINEKSGKFLINSMDARCQKLTIKNFDFSDNGKYFISVTNAVDTVSDHLTLKVEGNKFFLFVL